MRTQDGGRHWQQLYPCQMKAEVNGLTRNLTCQFAKLFFLNEQVGWTISNAGAGGAVLAKTHDDGTTLGLHYGFSWRRPAGRLNLLYRRQPRLTVDRRKILLFK
jgi:hypothetical protein